MTKEEIFRAFGNADDRFVNEIAGYIGSDSMSVQDDTDPFLDLSDERTIVMNVVRKKNRRISKVIIVAAVLAAAAAAVTAVIMGTRKDKKEYKEKIIENYFIEDENFEFSGVKFLAPEQLYSDKSGIYFSGYMSFGSDVIHPSVSLYSTADNEIKVIEPEGCDSEYFEAVSVSDKNVWLQYNVSDSEKELIRIDTDTLQISGRLRFDKDKWIVDITENNDGTYLIRNFIYTNYKISDVLYSVYDTDLNPVSERSVIDMDMLSDPDTELVSHEKADDGSCYFVYRDAEMDLTLYKYSSEDEKQYSIENITDDLEGIYAGMFITVSGNPTVYSYDQKTDLYYFDEYDAESGYAVNRYEIKLDSTATAEFGWSSGSAHLAKGGSSGEYNFSYIADKKIYGCRSSDDGNELIADLSGKFSDSVSIESVAVSDDLILLSGTYEDISQSGRFICRADNNGNILAKNKTENILGKDDTSIQAINSDKNGEIWVLMQDHNTGKSIAVNLDKDLKPKKKTELDNINSEHFIADTSGRIALKNGDEIILFDAEGRMLCTEKIKYEAYFFIADGKYYAAADNAEDSGTVIYHLDFDNSRISEVKVLDFTFTDVMNGFGKYDVCFLFNDGVCGYKMKNDSVEELINWVDSDLDYDPFSVIIPDENTMLCRYWSYMEGNRRTYMSCIKRADDETLKKVQERKLINAAAGFMTDSMRSLIKEFNRTNKDYRIHIDDFSRYSDDTVSYFRDSGLSALDSEFVKGYVPDLVIFGQDFDILKYIGFDAFADLDELLPDVVSGQNDYFKNIIDAYKNEGKHYALPLTYSLFCLAGKSENVNGSSSFTVAELSELNDEKPIFYGEQYGELTELLISSNINEYIDIESFTCDFETESFVKLLELIKKNGVSMERHDTDISTYYPRLADGSCRLIPCRISSVSNIILNDYYNHIEESSVYAGLPSEKSSGIIIGPLVTAAVFDSSDNKDGAAEFLKYMLSEEIQYQSCLLYDLPDSFPVNKSAYMSLFEKQKNAESSMITDCYGNSLTLKNPDEKTLQTVNDLIASATAASVSDSTIRRIIDEETALYYSDAQSAEKTAENIQTKVSLYLKEIS